MCHLGIVMSKTPFSNFCVFMIFIISGIKLDTSSVKTALHYWPVRFHRFG